MGEIADDMLDGSCCSLCGQYFEDLKTSNEEQSMIYTHGYPVYCKDCYEPGCGHPKADVNTF